MRWFLFLLCLVFVVTLAAVIGLRVRSEGQAFVFGLACGAALGVPAGVLALYLARPAAQPEPRSNRRAYPPLVILNGPPPPRQQPLPDYPPLVQPQAAAREARYRVIGGDED